MRKLEKIRCAKARGGWWKPLASLPFSHFQAAREDRDGCSRYRVAKILLMQ